MAYPDVEKMLVGWLSEYLDVRTLVDTPENLQNILPVVQVNRFGGIDRVPGFDLAHIDVDVYAGTRGDASTLSERVRYALRFVLQGQSVDGLTVSRVDTIVSPCWRPYDNSSLRRYGASYSLALHAKTIREVTP